MRVAIGLHVLLALLIIFGVDGDAIVRMLEMQPAKLIESWRTNEVNARAEQAR